MEEQKKKLREVLPADVPDSKLEDLIKRAGGNLQIAVAMFYDPSVVRNPMSVLNTSRDFCRWQRAQPAEHFWKNQSELDWRKFSKKGTIQRSRSH